LANETVYFYPVRNKKNIVLDKVLVENYAAEGKSLARHDGKVVFIENVVPGDIVDIRLSKSKKDWAEGYPIHFRSYSAERVEPFCQHFGVCGGCQWQMLPYTKQLEYKQKQVWDNLTRIGKISLPEMRPIIGSDEDRWYRNKLEYTFSTKEYLPKQQFEEAKTAPDNISEQIAGKGVLGFHARGFFDKIVNIEKCWLQPEPTNSIRNAIRAFALKKGYSFYDYREQRGMLRNLLLRICTSGEIMVNLVFGQDLKESRKEIMDFILQEFPQITTLLYTINLKKNDSLNDLEPVTYSGKGYVLEHLEDFIFKIGPKSFFQTNTKQAEKLYAVTREFAELNGSQVLYDLYCGTGSIGIFCSRMAKKVIGVEMIEAAINDAKENALLNNIEHAAFLSGDVIDICNDAFFEREGRPDVVITDPPRAGMHQKLINKILDIEAPLIVYVSCNPATQARDLSLLDEKYQVTKVQPVDMFPHTHHIENVVQLKIRK
jgi:23S rRNA (uracil1939-C5)-methyltransferase